jgi:hypothetical protein
MQTVVKTTTACNPLCRHHLSGNQHVCQSYFATVKTSLHVLLEGYRSGYADLWHYTALLCRLYLKDAERMFFSTHAQLIFWPQVCCLFVMREESPKAASTLRRTVWRVLLLCCDFFLFFTALKNKKMPFLKFKKVFF